MPISYKITAAAAVKYAETAKNGNDSAGAILAALPSLLGLTAAETKTYLASNSLAAAGEQAALSIRLAANNPSYKITGRDINGPTETIVDIAEEYEEFFKFYEEFINYENGVISYYNEGSYTGDGPEQYLRVSLDLNHGANGVLGYARVSFNDDDDTHGDEQLA